VERIPAAILAGGASSRMGRDKVLVPVGGIPLLARAWNALACGFHPLFLAGRPDAPLGLVALPDQVEGLGPLGGLSTFLDRARRDGARGGAVLAVDLPGVGADTMVELFARWAGHQDAAERAVILADGGRRQPLAGIYGSGLAAGLRDRLGEAPETLAVAGWLDALGDRVTVVEAATLADGHGRPGLLGNVNTPDDLRRLDTGPPLPSPMVTIQGWKDSGKTTVAVELSSELRRRGYRVMAMKHGHGFRLDTPGTDSYRLRHEAGVERVVLAGPEGFAVMGAWGEPGSGDESGAGGATPSSPGGGAAPPGPEGRREEPGPAWLAATYLGGADIVVAEGWKHSRVPAVEVVGPEPAGEARPALLREDDPGSVRGVARCVRNGGRAGAPGGGVATISMDAAGWPALLADAVEAAVLPGTRWVRGEGTG
jgi:molybdopterin-guanine dinucleotide biosynthesis protein B/molybdopterin-guanine dinucleotide biosynthesis protein